MPRTSTDAGRRCSFLGDANIPFAHVEAHRSARAGRGCRLHRDTLIVIDKYVLIRILLSMTSEPVR